MVAASGHLTAGRRGSCRTMVVPPPCPDCNGALRVEWRLVAGGPANVAGMRVKFNAVNTPHLICDACGFVKRGKKDAQHRRVD
jgi:transposase